jgi:ATP-dependent metalloprotease
LLNQKAKDNKSPATRAAISVHESGHALVQILQTGVFPTRLNCVTADRSLLGYSATKTGSSVQVHTFADKRKELQVLYAGLAAEEVVFGKELTTGGSSNDILRATRMAGILVKKKGLGSVHYHADPLSSDCDWSVKADDSALDKEVAELLETVHADTLALLEENKTALVGLAHRLFEQETLDETEIRRYLLDELNLEVPGEEGIPFDALLQASFERHCGLRRVG